LPVKVETGNTVWGWKRDILGSVGERSTTQFVSNYGCFIGFTVDYDKSEVWKGLKQSGIGLAMVTFLHFKFGYVQPLIIQAILGFKTFFTTKEARIHLFNRSTSSGDLKRPFRVDSPFGMSSLNPQPKTDKASIKKAERAMKAD
jgi:hypothetical protein